MFGFEQQGIALYSISSFRREIGQDFAGFSVGLACQIGNFGIVNAGFVQKKTVVDGVHRPIGGGFRCCLGLAYGVGGNEESRREGEVGCGWFFHVMDSVVGFLVGFDFPDAGGFDSLTQTGNIDPDPGDFGRLKGELDRVGGGSLH